MVKETLKQLLKENLTFEVVNIENDNGVCFTETKKLIVKFDKEIISDVIISGVQSLSDDYQY